MDMSWKYIAGFFDGEGTIRMQMGNRAISIHAMMCQSRKRGQKLLWDIFFFLLAHNITSVVRPLGRNLASGKSMHQLYIYNIEEVSKFVSFVFPYLHIKKLECQDIVRFVKLYPAYYAWLANKMSNVGCEICGAPRKVNRSRTCGTRACVSALVSKVRHGLAPKGRYLPIKQMVIPREAVQ